MKPKRQKKLRLGVDIDTTASDGQPLRLPKGTQVFRATGEQAGDWLQHTLRTHTVTSAVTIQVVLHVGDEVNSFVAVLPDQLYETDL